MCEWTGATRELEQGAAVHVSGNGFADDLASRGSCFAEVLTADLIALTTQLGGASPEDIQDASSTYNDGPPRAMPASGS